VHHDGMQALVDKIEQADAYIEHPAVSQIECTAEKGRSDFLLRGPWDTGTLAIWHSCSTQNHCTNHRRQISWHTVYGLNRQRTSPTGIAACAGKGQRLGSEIGLSIPMWLCLTIAGTLAGMLPFMPTSRAAPWLLSSPKCRSLQ
jgi:hypothetical protein